MFVLAHLHTESKCFRETGELSLTEQQIESRASHEQEEGLFPKERTGMGMG